MSFSFLNPWLWFGALAVAGPLWLHLRRKRQASLIRFSTLRFLDDQPVPRQSPLRLQDVLLFAIRALALCSIVCGFAWPYIRGADSHPIKESRVYILDNTLSHRAGDGFARDKQRVLHEVAGAGPNVQVAVVELTSLPKVVVSFGDTRDAARFALEKLQPSFQRGSYLAAFRQANLLLQDSLGDKKRIVFLGDNQENQWNENADTPPFLRDVEVELPHPSTRLLPNLSLSEPRVQRVFLGDKSLINCTVKLRRVGDAKTANVILKANGNLIFNRALELQNQPESILLQAQWEADPSAWLRGEVTVEGTPDELPADNRLFFSLAPVAEGKVALLAQSSYLRLALSPDIMRGQWATRLLEPARLSSELEANQDADVLCLESSYLQSADARKLLSRYLSNGRGVLLFVNRVTPSVSGALRELGFESEGSIDNDEDKPEKFQFIFSNHPIFHPFLSPDYGNLMEISVWKHTVLKTVQAMPLVFSDRGFPLFFQGTKAQGKLFVAAFAMDREHTSWPVHQTFIPFLDLALQAARADDPTPTNFEPGEIASVALPAGAQAQEAVLRDEDHDLQRVGVEHGLVQIRLPESPGLYGLTYDNDTSLQKLFSVNPSPKESELTYSAQPEAITLWRMNMASAKASSPNTAHAAVSLSAVLQQRWWWWMVVGGLVALSLETLIGDLKGARRIAGSQGGAAPAPKG